MVLIISIATFFVVLSSLLTIADWFDHGIEKRVERLEGLVLGNDRIR